MPRAIYVGRVREQVLENLILKILNASDAIITISFVRCAMKVNIIFTMASVPNSRIIVSRLRRMGSASSVVPMGNINIELLMVIVCSAIARFDIIAQITAMKAKILLQNHKF